MTTAAASILFLCLLTVSIAHFLWAIGSKWPIRDPALLAHTVIGAPGVERVPRLAALVVALLVLAAAAIGSALGDKTSGGLLLTLAGIVLTLVFGIRGVLGYTSWWRARHPVEPFATLDKRIYSPLCLIVAVCFAVLVITRLT
ncbi:MAG TPA: DUF3995 domain-containing protein [Devosia sp.]